MQHKAENTRQRHMRQTTRWIVGLLALIALSANSRAAADNLVPTDYRLLTSAGRFDDTTQFAAAFRLRAPRRLRAHHLELALGTIADTGEFEGFVSLGPVWRFPLGGGGRRFVDFGFSPTLLTGTEFGGRDIGGHLHLTSSLAFGSRFGRNEAYSISLRAQHTSNGGLNSENPGLDMIGLTFAVEFRD